MTDADSPPRGEARAAARLREIAGAALEAFSATGYRLTQVAHVSERLGASVGSIYRYVDSKEALFHIAALVAMGRSLDGLPVPVKTDGFRDTLAAVAAQMAGDRTSPVLAAAMSGPAPANLRAEARAIGAELYDLIAARGALTRLLDRCAGDVPELYDQRARRRVARDLVTWTIRRGLTMDGGRSEAMALVRGATEAVTWLALHRTHDRSAEMIGGAEARDAAIRIFANSFD